jgi:hypothetical protein
MLLLSGKDIRFFHFNVVITLPLVFVLLTKTNVQRNIASLAADYEEYHEEKSTTSP